MHGDHGGGIEEYREAIRLFSVELARLGDGIRLENGTTLLKAMHSLITGVAINDDGVPVLADERSAPLASQSSAM